MFELQRITYVFATNTHFTYLYIFKSKQVVDVKIALVTHKMK